MLKAAAPAEIGMGAGRLDTIRVRLAHQFGSEFIESTVSLHHFCDDLLTRQRTVNKLGFAVDPGDTPAIVAQGFNGAFPGFRGYTIAVTSAHETCQSNMNGWHSREGFCSI